MPDTVRTREELQAIFANNHSRLIKPQGMRDFLASAMLTSENCPTVATITIDGTSYRAVADGSGLYDADPVFASVIRGDWIINLNGIDGDIWTSAGTGFGCIPADIGAYEHTQGTATLQSIVTSNAGADGRSGFSGFSGYSGVAGTSGATGISGYSGQTGCAPTITFGISYLGGAAVLNPPTGTYVFTLQPNGTYTNPTDGGNPNATCTLTYDGSNWIFNLDTTPTSGGGSGGES